MEDDGVHGLNVRYWELLTDFLKIEYRPGLGLDELGLLSDDLLSGLTLSSACSRLHNNHVADKVNHSQLRSGDLSVLMKTESLWFGVQWHSFDVVQVVFTLSDGNGVVKATFRELIAIFKNTRVDVTL